MPGSDARCKGCGYPLRGLPSGDCPECGRPFDWNRRTTYRLGDEPGVWRGMWITRKRALLRWALVFAPGLALFLSAALGWVSFEYWGCFLMVLYPFWAVACTVCALSVLSPMGVLGTQGSMAVGVVIATLFFIVVGLWGLTLAVPAGLVAGLVFKHMELNDLL